jgi:uncharacterized membrane protein
MGENNFAAVPVALYGLVVLLAAIAYFILTRVLIAHHGKDPTLASAIGRDAKGKISVGIYVIAVVSALIVPWFACLLYVLVAILWLIPDRRIERSLMT